MTEQIHLNNCSLDDFEVIFKQYYRNLYTFAYGYVMNPMEADDIVQEIFSKVWEIRHKLPEDLNINAYLYTSVRNRCLEYFRQMQLTDKYKKRQAEALILSYGEEEGDDEEVAQMVREALSNLSAQQQKIVDMHIKANMKYQEIAAALDLSENTVRTHLKRAYKILRENLSCILPGIFI